MTHDYYTAFWTIIGPVFFGAVAWAFLAFAPVRRRTEINAERMLIMVTLC